jgi:amphi-Trp domain-containing protein
MEETVFKFEKKLSNPEIADYLRRVADKVENGEQLNLDSGNDSVELDTGRDAEFEVKVEREDDEESLELEIEWKKGKGSELNVG